MYLDPNIPTNKNPINLNVFVNKLDEELLRMLKGRCQFQLMQEIAN
jgi:hypothetical protein